MSEAEKKQAGTQQAQAGGAPSAAAGKSSPDERNMAVLAHVLALFTGFVGPLIIWLIKKEQSDFVDDQGKEALNFQITMFICFMVAGLSMFVLIGILLMPAVAIFNIVNVIRGAIAANRGERFRYPLCIRLLK